MIGKKQLVFGARQFNSGMAASDYSIDGSLSTTSTRLNPFVLPGAMKGTLLISDQANNLADTPIASVEDGTGSLKARLFVGNAGKYYTVDTSGTIANVATGADTSNYVYGRTDIGIQSGASGNYYAFVSHGTNVALWNGSTTLSESWWTGIAYYTGTTHPPALTASPHPMLNFNTNLWIADGSQLHNIMPNVAFTTATLAVNLSVLSLDLYSTIYALGIDPTTGLMMISFQTVTNQSDTISTQAFIGLYDGYSTGLRRKIPVDDLVTGFHNVGGQVFCAFGPKIGYWNGNGITFLRNLTNVTNASASLITNQRMTNIGNILLVANGSVVMAYGEVTAGMPKAWFNVGETLGSPTDKVSCLAPLGNNQYGIFHFYTAASFSNLRSYSLSSTVGTSFNVVFTKTFFERPIFVQSMRVITTGIAYSGFTDIVAGITDEKGNSLPIAAANSSVSVPTGTTYVKDFNFGGAKCQGIQPSVGMVNGTWGLVQVIIYYDIAE